MNYQIEKTNGRDPRFKRLTRMLDEYLELLNGKELQQDTYNKFNSTDSIEDAYILLVEGKLVGCGAFKPYNKHYAELKRVFITPGFRRNHLATELIQAIEDDIKKAGFLGIVLESATTLKSAHRLYESLGFKKIDNYEPYVGLDTSYCFQKDFHQVKIYQLIDGAKQAKGATVIIDVFRAFTVEAYALENHAIGILPVATIEEAFLLKEEHPDYILIGERGGKKIEGFDYGNSPSEIENIDFTNRMIVHTTSAGTQGIANAKGASILIGGSLVNAKATASYLQNLDEKDISLVCMGLEGKKETDEDTLCANVIQSYLRGDSIDIEESIKKLATTSGAKFFDSTLTMFPQKDFELCTKLNQFDFVMVLEGNMIKKYQNKDL